MLVAKPTGPTSHDIVKNVRRAIPRTKVGHTGTLDPAASGLLVLCIGRLTRLARFFADLRKEYRGTILFGRETDTLDLSGRTVRRSVVPHDLFERARELLPALMGRHVQTVPQFSAAKWKGKPFHRWVRAGHSPPVRSKEAEVFDAEIWQESRSVRRIEFKIAVNSGFYVRSWARDFGAKLGVPATLCRLARTRIGPMSLCDALPVTELSFEKISDGVIQGKDVLDWIPSITFDDAELQCLRDGKMESLQYHVSVMPPDPAVRVLDQDGNIAAMVRLEANRLKPVVVLMAKRENQ